MSIQMQENTVQEVVNLAPEGWEKVEINIEIDDVDGEIIVSPKSKYFIDGKAHELRLGIDATDCFEELREDMQKSDSQNRPWTICDLEILSDGTFNFKFSYDEPPRLAELR